MPRERERERETEREKYTHIERERERDRERQTVRKTHEERERERAREREREREKEKPIKRERVAHRPTPRETSNGGRPNSGINPIPVFHGVLSNLLFVFTLLTGPRRSLSLKLSDTRVYAPKLRAIPNAIHEGDMELKWSTNCAVSFVVSRSRSLLIRHLFRPEKK